LFFFLFFNMMFSNFLSFFLVLLCYFLWFAFNGVNPGHNHRYQRLTRVDFFYPFLNWFISISSFKYFSLLFSLWDYSYLISKIVEFLSSSGLTWLFIVFLLIFLTFLFFNIELFDNSDELRSIFFIIFLCCYFFIKFYFFIDII
jgi:hypothetical protein